MAALIWRLPPRSSRWRSVRPELAGIGAMPAALASWGVGCETVGAGDLADELGRGQRSAAGLGDQLQRQCGHQLCDLGLERLIAAVSSRSRRSSSRAMRTRIVCSARARRRAIFALHLFENNAPPGSVSS